MSKPSVEETFLSVNGFDDIAVEQKFGKELSDLSPVKTTRALVFVLKRRDGSSDADAFRAVMEMGLGDLNECFSDGEAAPEILADLGESPGKALSGDETNGGPTSS